VSEDRLYGRYRRAIQILDRDSNDVSMISRPTIEEILSARRFQQTPVPVSKRNPRGCTRVANLICLVDRLGFARLDEEMA